MQFIFLFWEAEPSALEGYFEQVVAPGHWSVEGVMGCCVVYAIYRHSLLSSG